MITVTEEDFDISKTIEEATHPDVGAIVTFTGIVRDDGINGMGIDANEEPAMQELGRIREEALKRFDIKSLDIIHRTGRLSVGERILFIVCSAPHRKDAFAACEYTMDELQKIVSIRKRELT